ncbi:MAG: tyrosine-type recombinase/integrase [Gammaproteobacteria bacterium]|nr:tyrosine-type recombinase/integrase [Gammaproteobacteria bacterium]
MPSSGHTPMFRSPFATLMEQFVREKRASGYRYRAGAESLMRFDRFLADEAPGEETLSRPLVLRWLAKRTHESPGNHAGRITTARQFALFLCRLGHPAYVPDGSLGTRRRHDFLPRILTHAEVRKLLQAVDELTPTALSPLRHLVMPEIFRLLCGCGFRVGELLKLRAADVDLDRGMVTVRDAKFGKDRLVPPAPSLVARLRAYYAAIGARSPDAFFFPSHQGGACRHGSVYVVFRQLLLRCGMAHGGRGKGPRLHDLRHTFAVHAMLRWYREGADLDAKLPVLATYLGHQSLLGTQHYLHMTAELFPEVAARADAAFGDVIPRRTAP